MKRKILVEILILSTFAVVAFAQDPSPSPTPSRTAAQDQLAQLQEQIELMKKQQEYEKTKSELANQRLNELMKAIPRDNSFKSPEAKTTFNDAVKANPESAELSYVALRELSSQIGDAMRRPISGYTGIVIYNEPDFIGLAKYRLYRNLSNSAINNYKALIHTNLKEVNTKTERPKFRGFDPVTTALSLPAMGSMFAKSVADLLSIFRTETTIDTTNDTVDSASLGAAMANELRKVRPDLKIFYPMAFVPEYELESEGSDSLLVRITEVNEAYADLEEFLSGCEKLDAETRNDKDNKTIIARVKGVQKQLESLLLGYGSPSGQNNRSASENDNARPGWTEIRQLIRAEKLDSFMRQGGPTIGSAKGPHVGILKLRTLASGGSRRETRNLFLGNRISYSGSVTLEVLLFDVDGMLRASEIFSLHTGFRKLKTSNN